MDTRTLYQATAFPQGLSEQEVLARRARGQGNSAAAPTSRPYRQILTENVFTFINICLFGLGIALALLGQIRDALVSTAVITTNLVVSLVQEIHAKRTLDRIALLTRPTATVLREGRERAIPPDELVVGDVLRVGPGDQIMVDGRVIGDGRLTVDESLLTGEADLISKRTGDPVYSGSFCVTGGAYFEAEHVGAESLSNQMTASARAFRRVLTPLQREIHLVIRLMLVIVVYVEFLLTLTALIKHISLPNAVQQSTLTAGLVPNGLFLSIAAAYALGAVRILRYGALVQQANAIESLSHVDVLCLDKTGTLTANRLQVSGVYPLGISQADLTRVLGAMAASATGGNKTSEAIAATYPSPKHRIVGEVPFSSARKWSAVAFDDQAGADDGFLLHGVYALGAPEMLRPYLGAIGSEEPAEWQAIAARARDLADQGLRVLLVAHTSGPAVGLDDQGDASVLPEHMRPLGLISLSDELRPEARATLEALIQAGVRPKIISGDHPETVAALALQAGLKLEGHLVSGPELEEMDETEYSAAAESATIFGRISPHQKEHLVRALRQRGHYVAMIGDGVNDVLSLKQAQLGIAMRSGSQAARAVADLVLMEDSFAVLVPAVTEGQRIRNGMQDILKLFLTRISTIGLVILSSLVVGTFPLELRQGSIVTLFSVGIPSVLLAVWARPGAAPAGSLVRRLLHFILTPLLITTVLALLLFFGTYIFRLQEAVSELPVAQSTLTAFLVICGLLLIIFVEPPTEWWTGGNELSGDWRPTLLALGLMAAFVIVDLVPLFRGIFALSFLDPIQWLLVLVTATIWLFLTRWAWRLRLLSRFLDGTLG